MIDKISEIDVFVICFYCISVMKKINLSGLINESSPTNNVVVCFELTASLSYDEWRVRLWNSNRNESSTSWQGLNTFPDLFVFTVEYTQWPDQAQ